MSGLRSARFKSKFVSARTSANRASTKKPLPNLSSALKAWVKRSAASGKGTKRARGFWCKVLRSASTFCPSMPITNQSARSSLTWLSTYKGTVTVMPSLASPGSCKYSTTQSTPPKRTVAGKACVVMPAAWWRINSSLLSSSKFGCRLTSSRYQRSSVTTLHTSAGNCWS